MPRPKRRTGAYGNAAYHRGRGYSVIEGAAPQHPAAAIGLPLPVRWNHLAGAIIIPQPLAQVKSQGLVEITGISFLG
jgi:hypothetical protein